MTDKKFVVNFTDPTKAPVVTVAAPDCKTYMLQAQAAAAQVGNLDNILYVGETEPTLPNVYAWINPTEDEDFAVSMEDAIQAAQDAKFYAELTEGNVLPTATANTKGGIIVGDNLTIDADGRLSATTNTNDYYTKAEVDAAIANALTSFTNGDEVGY